MLTHEPREALNQYARLAGTRAGQDADILSRSMSGVTLRVAEAHSDAAPTEIVVSRCIAATSYLQAFLTWQ